MAETRESKFGWKALLRIGPKHRKLDTTQVLRPPPEAHEKLTPGCNVDHQKPLETKYGKVGKIIGEGAGGSVQLVTRPLDGVTFAVKKFRNRHPLEEEKHYVRKIVAEYYIGSCLRHENIIETLDLLEERHQWYQVMEYAPYDLFNLVQSGGMLAEEIECSFMQILAGVSHLHRLGFAHRDLKLENVIVSEKGIMKIIDFGIATICRHPLAKNITLAADIVGCLPYMAPEIFSGKPYDPQKADIWSLAIIYCCMALGAFPWKVARLSDKAFASFVCPPTPDIHIERELQRLPTDIQYLDTSDAVTVIPCDLAPTNSETTSRFQINSKVFIRKGGKEPVLESCRLLRRLPGDSRAVIWGMLQVNPQSRFTMQQISQNSWVKQGQKCLQGENGIVNYVQRNKHNFSSR